MNFIVKKGKKEEVHTDTIRVFENKRRDVKSNEIISSGSVCKVNVTDKKTSVHAILRGVKDPDNEDFIYIDESLRNELKLEVDKPYNFTFESPSVLGNLLWAMNTTDTGYRISTKIAGVSLILGLLGFFFSFNAPNIPLNIPPEKLSSIISILVAVVILFANFFQWWDITWNGGMITKTWVKYVFAFSIAALLFSLFLII